jgi:hypothetical protein
VINAIINNKSISGFFRQIADPQFAVTGGRLDKINDEYYLVGGHKFMGRYNPMGPDRGPGFTQEYTNQIRKFSITDNGTALTINHWPSITDSTNLHRRDFNLIPQIFPDGQEGLTAFSGVFQYDIDLPFINAVNIEKGNYSVNPDFSQYYNHYHSANIPIYSLKDNEMHNVFFGGIAQYFESNGMLTQDNNIPFVKTIARVSRDANGKMTEYKLPVEMPALLGAGSEFFAIDKLPAYANGVIKLDELKNDNIMIGYIYGGINSKEANIFWTNEGTESNASHQIFKVFLNKNNPAETHRINEQSTGSLKLQARTSTVKGIFKVIYQIQETTDIKFSLYTDSGKIIEEKIFKNMTAGEHIYLKKMKKFSNGGVYILTVETSYEKAVQKIIVDP